MITVTLSVLLTPLFVLLVWLAVEDRARRTLSRPATNQAPAQVAPDAATPAARDYASVSER